MHITTIDANIVSALERPDRLQALGSDSHLRSLTDMLRRNGPLQTIAFLTSKKSENLLAALQAGLTAIPGHPGVQLEVRALARLATGDLLALSQRLTRVAVWLNRLVEATAVAPEATHP